jgi:hypothetical protein
MTAAGVRIPVPSARSRTVTTTIDLRSLVLGPLARRVPSAVLLATFSVCATIVWVSALRLRSATDLIPVVRVATVVFAGAAATCLEDANEAVVDAAPFGRLRRRSATVAMTGAATVALWSIVMSGALIIDHGATGARLPVGGLLVELGAICAFGWLVAAALISATTWRGTGARAAAGVVVAALFSLGHPRSIEWLWAMPGPTWRAAHERWTVVGVLAIWGLLVLSRDPAARRNLTWRPLVRSGR